MRPSTPQRSQLSITILSTGGRANNSIHQVLEEPVSGWKIAANSSCMDTVQCRDIAIISGGHNNSTSPHGIQMAEVSTK
jgi:hypothetical protein